MKIVFFGTPDYVTPVLDSLHKTFKNKTRKSPIVAVITQKPKPTGRKKIPTYSPVDKWAHQKKVPIFYQSTDLVEKNIHADVGILAAYGEIIPAPVLSHFPFGILNIHPSLLPKWRGASPIQATITSGDKETGVTIIKLDEELDHGPIVSQFKEEVQGQDTTDSLRTKLFNKSAEVITTLLPPYLKGKVTLREQDHHQATFTTQIRKADGFIPPKYLEFALNGKKAKEDWKVPFIKNFTIHCTPITIHQFIRAMQPWPHAWTSIKLKVKNEKFKIKRLKILKAHLEKSPSTIHHPPSTKLVLDQVQLEGKNPVTWKQFKEGHTTVTFE